MKPTYKQTGSCPKCGYHALITLHWEEEARIYTDGDFKSVGQLTAICAKCTYAWPIKSKDQT